MKVIILGSAHPLRGGLASYNERLAREFIRQGHSVQIYTFSLQYPGFLFPGTSQYSDAPAPDDLYIHVKVNSINPFNWRKVGKEIQKLSPDLLIVKFWLPFMAPCLGTISRIVKKNGKTKVISIDSEHQNFAHDETVKKDVLHLVLQALPRDHVKTG